MSFKEDLQIEKKYAPYYINKFTDAGFQVFKMEGKFSFFDYVVVSPSGTIKTVELKTDVYALRTGKNTGNITIEVSSYDKPSGIMITKSDFFIYQIVLQDKIIELSFNTNEFREWLLLKNYRLTKMGDVNSRTFGHIIKISDIDIKAFCKKKEIKL